MKIPFWQADAFTGAVFSGNPAGVCVLEAWPADDVLQAIAAENNLSETAFLVNEGQAYGLRWFSPLMEVDLCGHATLASAFVLFETAEKAADALTFRTRSGPLTVVRSGERLAMDFPARRPEPYSAREAVSAALGLAPAEVHRSVRDIMAVYETPEQVQSLQPDMEKLARLDCLGMIAAAPGRDCDFVSRFFAPRAGIPEDPVTGSAHCTLAPYWAGRLGKSILHARQISKRGGELFCEDHGDRVRIGGRAALYLQGTLFV